MVSGDKVEQPRLYITLHHNEIARNLKPKILINAYFSSKE